jgi:hypothetical protein
MQGFDLETKTHATSLPANAFPTPDKSLKFFRRLQPGHQPGFHPEVLRWSRSHPNADMGVRLDLNSDWSSYRWRPVSSLQRGSGLTDPGGYLSSCQVSVAQPATPAEVESELRAQIDMAKRAGIPISHLDNHMRAMLGTPALFQSYWKMGQEYGLPIMLPNQRVKERGVPGQKPGVLNFGGVEVYSFLQI